MVDFDRELPPVGYVITLPSGEEKAWCTDCYDDAPIGGDLFTKTIRKGQFRAGNWRCEDCGGLV